MRFAAILLAFCGLAGCDDGSTSPGAEPEEDTGVQDTGVRAPDATPPDAGPTCTPVAETCDGQDNDCDGTADEGLGVGEACTRMSGPCTSQGRSVCAPDGTVTCDAPEPAPIDELCDAKDNDCDGNIDEGIDLAVDPRNCGQCGRACAFDNANVGCDEAVCILTSCTDGFGDANGIIADGCECQVTGAETCDNNDNDCDGQVDEGLGVGDDCEVEEGGCRVEGFLACGEGGAVVCSHPPIVQGPEVCDGEDNDCDGSTDEDFDADGDGYPGAEACRDGLRTDCRDDDAAFNPGARDVCEDGIDQNCDGADAPCGGTSSWVNQASIAGRNGVGCQDFNGDGMIDNAFSGVGPLANGNIQDAIDGGDLVLLPTTYGLAVGQRDARFDLAILLGEFVRAGTYRIDPRSYDAQGDPQALFVNATLEAGRMTAGPGNFPFEIPAGGFVLAVEVERTRILGEVTLDAQGLTIRSGWISGIVPEESLQEALLALPPDIAMLVPLVLQPDVDRDGDGQADAYSTCLQFEAVPTTILE